MSLTLQSYKVGVLTPGDREWVYNGLRFASAGEARAYGADLYARWTAVRDVTVTPCADVPNYAYIGGRVVALELPSSEAAA